jgi:hypothetical protein
VKKRRENVYPEPAQIGEEIWLQISLALNGDAKHDAKVVRDFANIFNLPIDVVQARVEQEIVDAIMVRPTETLH